MWVVEKMFAFSTGPWNSPRSSPLLLAQGSFYWRWGRANYRVGGVLQIKAFSPHQLLVSCSSWEIILDAKNTLRRHLITEEHSSLSVPSRPIRIPVFSTIRELNKMLCGYELSSTKKDCYMQAHANSEKRESGLSSIRVWIEWIRWILGHAGKMQTYILRPPV